MKENSNVPSILPASVPPMILLLTGFGLWGTESVNASWEAIRKLDTDLPDKWSILRRRLPVDWEQGPATLRALLDDRPGAVLCFGMFDGDHVRPERRALNRNNPNRRDAREALPASTVCEEGGPAAYETGLDTPSLAAELRSAGLPAAESDDAGDFLCNSLFYTLMHERSIRQASFPAGFIHLPHVRSASRSGLAPEELQCAARVCIDHAIALAERSNPTPRNRAHLPEILTGG